MNIIIINKEIFQNRPPVISTLLSLCDLGHKVSLITVSINDYWRQELQSRNVSIYVIPDRQNRNKFNKIIEYIYFKRKVFLLLDRIVSDKKSTFIWTIGGNTIFCLGENILKYRFILQIQELHENDNRYQKLFSKVLNKAETVFVNEFNRAVLFQCWHNLQKRPNVIPNKPYFIDTKTSYDLSTYVDQTTIDKFTKSKVVLFQGQIVDYRDLSPYIRAAKELGGYQIVLLGNDYGMVEKYRRIDPNLIYIRRIPAPQYLGITVLAHICLITYDEHSLNNAYCAPNKIYEYGAFGKPMIGNKIPGLKVIEDFKAGKLIDETDISTIKDAMIEIEENYIEYSNGAISLYSGTDNMATIEKALNSIQ